jgi:hypothetical protein
LFGATALIGLEMTVMLIACRTLPASVPLHPDHDSPDGASP